MQQLLLLPGIFLVALAIIFLIKPQTYFAINTNKKKAKTESKQYLKSLTNKKILSIRLVWSSIMLLGIFLIIISFMIN